MGFVFHSIFTTSQTEVPHYEYKKLFTTIENRTLKIECILQNGITEGRDSSKNMIQKNFFFVNENFKSRRCTLYCTVYKGFGHQDKLS